MHKYQKLQDLLIKFPQEHAHKEGQIKSLVLQTNYNPSISNSSSLLLVLYQYYLWTGAWPQTCQAKKSVASFKLRKGMDIGVKQTLSGGGGGQSGSKKIENFLQIFLLNMVNLRSQSASSKALAQLSLSKTGQANLGIENIENLKAFYQDKEEGQHALLSSYPTFGVNITFNLPSAKAGWKLHKNTSSAKNSEKIQRLRNAMILSQYQLPVAKVRI